MILNSCSCKNYLQGSQSPTSTLSPEATTQQVMLLRNRIFYSLLFTPEVWSSNGLKFVCTKVSSLLRGDEEIEGSVREKASDKIRYLLTSSRQFHNILFPNCPFLSIGEYPLVCSVQRMCTVICQNAGNEQQRDG